VRLLAALAIALALLGVGIASWSEPVSVQDPPAAKARLRPYITGLASPVDLAAPLSEPNRLYIVEQGGRIRVAVNGKLRAAPFLDVHNKIVSGGEQGLLGLAFHPRYATNKRFYVDYTDRNGDTRVVEYRSNGTRAIPSSARQLLFVDQPYANHNGGGLAFGPDGKLYVGMGDGGAGGDPEDRAQNMGTRLGKLLRIDVATGRISIAALGLRNPWRFAFDRANGDLYIGDVGQSEIEEIDYLPREQLGRLQNYGWNIYEGRSRFESTPQGPGRLVMPVTQYTHAEGCSVTGGFVYRGKAVKAYVGRYLYGDYCSGRIWSLEISDGKATSERREAFSVPRLSSFGEDAAGELYAVSQRGTVYRLAP
jgi:glucose/arabinose dehydrogenase